MIVLVLLKFPEKGRVKTRLARDIGEERALEVYRELLQYTFDLTDSLDPSRFQTVAVCDPSHGLEKYRELLYRRHCGFSLQRGGDLGERMKNALELFTPAILIGSDCRELTKRHIEEAATALTTSDLVLGPARDGGYYLIGANRVYPELFCEMPWSTEKVFEMTMERAKQLSLAVHTLETLRDIDTAADL